MDTYHDAWTMLSEYLNSKGVECICRVRRSRISCIKNQVPWHTRLIGLLGLLRNCKTQFNWSTQVCAWFGWSVRGLGRIKLDSLSGYQNSKFNYNFKFWFKIKNKKAYRYFFPKISIYWFCIPKTYRYWFCTHVHAIFALVRES